MEAELEKKGRKPVLLKRWQGEGVVGGREALVN